MDLLGCACEAFAVDKALHRFKSSKLFEPLLVSQALTKKFWFLMSLSGGDNRGGEILDNLSLMSQGSTFLALVQSLSLSLFQGGIDDSFEFLCNVFKLLLCAFGWVIDERVVRQVTTFT